MDRDESKIVRSRLDEYKYWESLAKEYDKMALLTQELLATAAYPHSPGFGNDGHCQNPVPIDTKMNEILSDEMEFDTKAKTCRERMKNIETFIERNVSSKNLPIFRAHFYEGIPYEEMEFGYNYSAAGLKSIVYRELEKIEFADAKCLF